MAQRSLVDHGWIADYKSGLSLATRAQTRWIKKRGRQTSNTYPFLVHNPCNRPADLDPLIAIDIAAGEYAKRKPDQYAKACQWAAGRE